ncbi:MAG TPA: hypothetical protein PKY59_08100 [Pyrinomonadaceae bacterium]|nr:hypothetical protein [Pyrinomonadaceae bacterium]
MKNNFDKKVIEDLNDRKKTSRSYLRSLSLPEKVEKLVQLQNQYYQMLLIREQNGGRPIPEKWRKWYKARFESF